MSRRAQPLFVLLAVWLLSPCRRRPNMSMDESSALTATPASASVDLRAPKAVAKPAVEGLMARVHERLWTKQSAISRTRRRRKHGADRSFIRNLAKDRRI